MAIHYPNGKKAPLHDANFQPKKQVQAVQFGKRGMSFEEKINRSNEYYLTQQMAVIHKKPTPIQIVQVDYPRRSAAVIREAYFRQASTTDYNGVYQKHYIDFEAKETQNKQSFPLRNFHEHQIEHFRQCLHQGAICFVLIWFSAHHLCYLYPAEDLLAAWDAQHKTGKKSISFQTIAEKGFKIQEGYAPQIPYLQALDQYLQKKE